MKITDTHVYFWRGIFSNWHICEFTDPDTGIKFHNTEQAFMWYKADFFKDENAKKLIESENDPQKVKKLGRAVEKFDEKIWESVRFTYMVHVNKMKFSQNHELKTQLLETFGKILTEASPYDTIWGVGLREEDPLILDEKNWRGLNLLGESLMTVRYLFKLIKN